ncbi:MAG: citrate/2-methylcitrate synthase, partial [Candidatus Hodarchaeales archaeon]
MTTELFSRKTRAIIYGFQRNAIQRMLDFDFVCKRETPSVAAVIRPSQAGAVGYHKVFWGGKEIVIPIYRKLDLAVKKHPEADVLINFSSFRSAYSTSMEALNAETIKTVAIIAEGIPERKSRQIRKLAEEKGKVIIGPATVGGIQAGAFKIGNAAGTIENVVLSKLYRPGSVGFVSKSGGMSNEMNF